MLRPNMLLLSMLFLFLFSCAYPVRTDSGPSVQNSPQKPSSADTTIGKQLTPDTKTIDKQLTPDTKTTKDRFKQKRKNYEQEVMDEALDLLDQSQDFWEKGALENALETLDRAYGLILDIDGDLEISRQKDDLRFMISKRILEIYTSTHTVATGNGSEIPLIMNKDIEKEIRLFQTSERGFFIRSYQQSGLYRQIILDHLKKAGLPEELSWLPLVESGFKTNAFSRARALGLWQFIPSTGYKFGLKRGDFVDERMDVVKSTEAAIAYLKELHGMFGDWTTVLAAYNCGEGRVLKVISGQHINYLDRFWDLYRQLPYETARYVPRFLATLHIIKNPDKYGMDLSADLTTPISYELVKTNKCMSLRDISLYLNISEKTLTLLNPELRYKLTPDREYDLKVPAGAAERFVLATNKIPERKAPHHRVKVPAGAAERFVLATNKIPERKAPHPAFVIHRVKRGESLSVIAERYKSSVRAILTCNHLKSRDRIREGRQLKVPIRSYGYIQPATNQHILPGKIVKYRVKRGDSLWLLAKHFNTTISEIKEINNLRSGSLHIGQIIKIKSRTATNTYKVRKGDSLYTIARKHKVSLKSLLRMNSLSRTDRVYPGQIIIVER